jgi:hypothetical protein
MTSAIFALTNVVLLACLAVLAVCTSLTAMAGPSTSSGAGKLNVHHYVDVGVNFPYYVLARTDFRIPPFAGYDHAYEEIHRKYGKVDVDWESVPRVRDAWWDWWWRASCNGPYESVEQAIAHIHSGEGDAEFSAAAEKLRSIANNLVSDYAKHWEDIRAEVGAVVESMLESLPTEKILSRNEEIMGRTYEPGEAAFYYNLLRTTTAQSGNYEKDGNIFHLYVVGLDYLRNAEGFAGFMAHELRHILINQSGVFGREDIRSSIERLHSLTESWRDSTEVGCIIENMNFVLDAWFEHGIDFEFSQTGSYTRREEDRIIGKAFYDNRRVLAERSFEEFVEASLSDLSKSKPRPFTGNINAVGADRGSVVLIVPTNESGKAVQSKIQDYVKAIRDRFYKDRPILTDEEALKQDLSSNAIVVYGTTEGNLWLAKHFTELPVQIESDRIVADEVYSGDDLRFITSWPNPGNPAKGLRIYTAQRAEDVVGINSVFHGPTDYVVAKGEEILRAAYYHKQDGQWTFPTADDTLTLQVMHEILTLIRQYLVEAHPEPFHAITEDEFENLYNELKAKCSEPMPLGKFYFLANRLACAMKDAHTWLNYQGYDLYLPVRMVWASDGLGILDTGEDFAGIKHSRVLSMGGAPAGELLQRLGKIIPSENIEWVKAKAPGALCRRSVLEHILGKTQIDALTLEIERDGVRKEVSLPFGSEITSCDGEPQFFWDIIPEIKAGYFSLKSCNDTEDYRRSVQNLFLEMKEHGCENLIIDLRGNGGGNSSVVDEFLRKMPGKEFLSYSARIRVSKHATEQRGYDKSSFKFEGESDLTAAGSESKWHKPAEDQRVTPFKGKVYILVDRHTFSSGNWFAVIFSDNQLGTIVGEKTGNALSKYGDLLRFELPGQFSLSMSHKIFVRPDPSRDPSDGLVPDIEVPTTLADVFAGHDPQMEWLIKELYPGKGKPLSEEEVGSLIPKAPAVSEGAKPRP